MPVFKGQNKKECPKLGTSPGAGILTLQALRGERFKFTFHGKS